MLTINRPGLLRLHLQGLRQLIDSGVAIVEQRLELCRRPVIKAPMMSFKIVPVDPSQREATFTAR